MDRRQEAEQGIRRCLELDPDNERAKVVLLTLAGPDEGPRIMEELEAERRRKERELVGADWEARERQVKLDAWRSLSARSAHRIGNQLFASQGALRTLRKGEDPEMKEAAADLEESLQRVRQIVQQFQAFSRNEPPRLRAADVGPFVRDVVRRYARAAEGKEVSAEVPEGLPVCLLDRDQIDQALGELLENAIHFMPAGGSVRVTVEPVEALGGQRVRIVVQDTGPGVPEKDKERIFAPFVTTKPGGSGLGLAIVRQFVENHGGTIRETGTEGEGARFEIELPVRPTPEENQP
jgi:signal transduction histidine kinase